MATDMDLLAAFGMARGMIRAVRRAYPKASDKTVKFVCEAAVETEMEALNEDVEAGAK